MNNESASPEMVIETIPCAGSPHAIGKAQGQALREQITSCRAALSELEALQLARPRWLPDWAFLRMAERSAGKVWRNSVAPADQVAAKRLQGIAEGSGMRASSFHLLNLLEAMISDLREQTTSPPIGGCSAMAIAADSSCEGEPMIARNFDYLPLIQPFYFLRDTRPENGQRSLDFSVAPLVGAVDGMNEAGLCITFNYAFAVDANQPSSTISMAISQALSDCKTVKEAVALLRSRPRWGGGLLMLADAEGDIASLELANTRAEVRRPIGKDGLLFHSNRFQTQAMREVELAGNAVYSAGAPESLRGRVVHDSSTARDARFASLVAGRDRFTVDEVTAIMSDHGLDGCPSSETICMHSDYWFTTACLQLFPFSRRMRIAFNSACRANFVEFAI